MIAIDDLQWLDAPSAAVVEYAARRLGDTPVHVIVSVRAGSAHSLLPVLERELGLVRIDVGPLSVAALHRILGDALGARSRGRRSCGSRRRRAATRSTPSRSRAAATATVPALTNFDELVQRRLEPLPEPTRAALLRVAALARADTAMVDAADLAPAEEAGLVRIDQDGRIHFVHPLFASSVYAAAPLARRRETHRALVEVVADPVERARHLALAADGADAGVLDELRAAARHARAHAAPDTAAELIELALRLAPDGPQRAEAGARGASATSRATSSAPASSCSSCGETLEDDERARVCCSSRTSSTGERANRPRWR